MKLVSAVEEEKLCVQILEKLEVPSDHANLISNSLVTADLRGVFSHGISRLPVYASRVQQGLINPKPEIKIIRETPSTSIFDGDNGFGHVIGTKAMRVCIEKAKLGGIAVAGVCNSTHFGTAGYFALMAVDANMIGIAASNGAPRMAAWGGKTPLLGTNPLAVAAPTGRGYPLLLDMATSAAAVGKILIASKEGESIPSGWALDKDGHPTNDPSEALMGLILPLGGPKGYGLALMLDVLCGVLTGAYFGSDVKSMYRSWDAPEGLGHFFGAINIESLISITEFKQRIDKMCTQVKASELASGFDTIYLPGEIEFEKEVSHHEQGILINSEVWAEIESLAKDLNVHIDLYD